MEEVQKKKILSVNQQLLYLGRKYPDFTEMFFNFKTWTGCTSKRNRIFLQWKPTRCTNSHIYLIKYSTCFGQVHCPSSGVSQHCIHAIGICHASSVGVCRRQQN